MDEILALGRRCGLPALISALALLLLFSQTQAQAEDEPLKGKVEETGILPTVPAPAQDPGPFPAPVLPARKKMNVEKARTDRAPLSGSAREDALSGQVESERGEYELETGEGRIDPKTGRLHGSAVKEGALMGGPGDPDADDQELLIEWDRWRNRFLHAVQSGMQETLNNPSEVTLRWDPQRRAMVSRFPLGTSAWFSCQVTPDRRIVNLKLLHSSGYPGYDQAVLDAVNALDGSSILRYPRNSRRKIVSQVAGIKTAETSEYRYFKFGDVERHVIPGQ